MMSLSSLFKPPSVWPSIRSPYNDITNHSALFDQSTEITLVVQGILYRDIRVPCSLKSSKNNLLLWCKMFETVERMLCTRTLGMTAFAVLTTAIVPLSSAMRWPLSTSLRADESFIESPMMPTFIDKTWEQEGQTGLIREPINTSWGEHNYCQRSWSYADDTASPPAWY